MISKHAIFSSFATLLVCVVSTSATQAAGTGGCESFDWPLATELAWISATDGVTAESGTNLKAPPEAAITLNLRPAASASLAAAPSGKPKQQAADQFAGFVAFDTLPKAGTWQVSLSGPGWIDVVQNGSPLAAGEHTGKSDCDALRKSVRFTLADGPFAVQVSGAPTAIVKITVRPAQ